MSWEESFTLRDILGNRTLGSKLAYKWVEKALKRLQEDLELSRFDLGGRFQLTKLTPEIGRETLSGQKEFGKEAIGFTAGVIDGELRMVSVFAFLKDRFVWIRKEVGEGEEYHQIVFTGD